MPPSRSVIVQKLRRRARPANILLLIVPSGCPSRLGELGLGEAAVVGELERLALLVGKRAQRLLHALALEAAATPPPPPHRPPPARRARAAPRAGAPRGGRGRPRGGGRASGSTCAPSRARGRTAGASARRRGRRPARRPRRAPGRAGSAARARRRPADAVVELGERRLVRRARRARRALHRRGGRGPRHAHRAAAGSSGNANTAVHEIIVCWFAAGPHRFAAEPIRPDGRIRRRRRRPTNQQPSTERSPAMAVPHSPS